MGVGTNFTPPLCVIDRITRQDIFCVGENGNLEAGGGISLGVTPKSADYTATTADYFIPVNAAGGNVIITLPPVAEAFNSQLESGLVFLIMKIDSEATTVTIKGDGSELINSANTKVISAQFVSWTIITDGIKWFIIA